MQRSRGGADLLATVDPTAPPEDRARALATGLTELAIACRIDVRESVAFLSPAGAGAAARLADPELRQAIVTMGRAHGFPRVALIVGDD